MSQASARTGIVMVTHGDIGRALIQVAEFILGESLADVGFVAFRQSAMDETGGAEIRSAIEHADRGQGTLVLTDIGGASPFNAVARLVGDNRVALVSGANLAMLIRAWNYRDQPLERLARMASEGGVRDIRESSR